MITLNSIVFIFLAMPCILFRERYHCSASFLASEAHFNQLVKCESDSDCSDVDSTDYDSEELVNGKPVVTRSGRQVKHGYGLMF